MEVFRKAGEKSFVDELAQTVRENHTEAVEDSSDEELKEYVRIGIARARSHGLIFEDTITVFVRLMFDIAPNFDEQANIARMLNDERLEPDDRIELVLEGASEEDWAEAESLYDENAWEENRNAGQTENNN
ncbi:MAG TPA: hypothetical protein VGB00_18630 [Pyrinomonadaceae bacterium]